MSRQFHVENMKCAGCVSAVQEALEQLPDCEQATVDLEAATAEITGTVDPAQVVATLTALGYPATLAG